MHLTRREKNILLLSINAAFALITIAGILFLEATLESWLLIWMICCPIILVWHLVPINHQFANKIRDVFLFLLTGGAIGNTLGSIMNPAESLHWMYSVWLIPAVIKAIIHYSPSKKDRYMNWILVDCSRTKLTISESLNPKILLFGYQFEKLH